MSVRTALLPLPLFFAAVMLAACGSNELPGQIGNGNPGGSGNLAALVAPPDAPGKTNVVPASPAAGTTRPGQVYSIYVQAPTGDQVAFTVFEPATLEGGKKYPLVLQGHGYAGSRQTAAGSSNPTSKGDIGGLVAEGYGVISVDERGHGETGGTIRSMDPDFEGKDLLAILDWAEVKLDWLAYGPSADGSDPHNLIVGSIGGSYGGMFQYLIHNIDPRHRLDAMAPQIAPNDLNYSLFPYTVPKAGWGTVLFGAGNTAGNGTDRDHTDPFITSTFETALLNGAEDQYGADFFYYHSNAYFCNGIAVATNGGPGTAPERAPVRGPGVNALLFQGFRDTLFNFNDGYANYLCLKGEGGDVRLLTYQSGHNTLQVVPDPGQAFQPALDALDNSCGSLDVDAATLAFFNQYLKGIPGAANSVPTQPCLSLTKGDAVLVDQVMTGHAGTAVDVPATNLVAGLTNVPVPFDLGLTAGSGGDVLGGIPRLEVNVQPLAPGAPGDPIIFVGLGQMRATGAGAGVWDLVDNQIVVLRGAGEHDVDMVGVAERLAPGDKLALLFYGDHDQYHGTGSLAPANPTVMPVSVTGKVWIPLLGNLAPFQ